jgi:hypothetical protein
MLINLTLFVFNKLVHFENELTDFVKVIACKLLDVIMACTVDVIRWIFVFAGLIELNCVIEGNDFVATAVDDKDWTIYVRHAVDVWESVKWQRPSKVKDNSQGRHQWGVQDNPSYWVLFCKIARRS